MSDSEPVIVLDQYYLAITFFITLTIQSLAFLISYALQFDKITDFSGGANFAILALVTFLFGQTFEARNWVVTLATLLWSIRLAGFLLFRVLKRGQDNRFDEMRSNFGKFAGFWTFQLIWVWFVSWPITILNSPSISGYHKFKNDDEIKSFGSTSDIIGFIFWFIGLMIETLADINKYQWKNLEKLGKTGSLPVCRIGLWKWSRHPNYFGEILLWWGIWLMTIESAKNGGISKSAQNLIYASIISPIFITFLLMFISGLPTAERPVQQKIFIESHKHKQGSTEPNKSSDLNDPTNNQVDWQDFQAYLNQTSILIPIPNLIYTHLPNWLKHSILLDWPIYRFNEKVEGEHLIRSYEDSQPGPSNNHS
ncbi:hypothetical protein CROQUDRAFT_716696 [Cronartium quercuum f. sp. fusiforme G11]|uniref:Steroid 5-alpha reductase C-terminal domain-containing protein n=1 Tax=Cronartium quercuum f. sp. fusiforme G11 TaxID=708437 RepID=A0A9P6T9M9_9BASI|nr:hypothetical protein CROQUDRAFT_716696 [Cronartium quercuum f. sp. fusiforme G11]